MCCLLPIVSHIDHDTYFEGAPTVVVEIRSPGDETMEKLPFYAKLGVPEVWIIDRDTRQPELYLLKTVSTNSNRRRRTAGCIARRRALIARRNRGIGSSCRFPAMKPRGNLCLNRHKKSFVVPPLGGNDRLLASQPPEGGTTNAGESLRTSSRTVLTPTRVLSYDNSFYLHRYREPTCGLPMETVKVALIGFGTIGSGVAQLLLEHQDRIARCAGKKLELACVVDSDLKRPRNFALPPGLLTSDLAKVTDDPEIVAAIELVGGLEPARTIVLKLLESGKDIITANKALLAEHGPELFDKARKMGRSIAFEAAVAGGIPIIAAIAESLAANQIESIHAILNGTSNFILSQMEENDTDYAAALAEAQQRGYAEANPTMDVNGSDAAQKLAILAHLAFGAGSIGATSRERASTSST